MIVLGSAEFTNKFVCRMMSDWEVQLVRDNMSEFNVKFVGPKDSKSDILIFFLS